MPFVESVGPRPELAPFVRAYAQRTVAATDPACVQSVPAQLEQILNFELGVLPGIWRRQTNIANEILVGGAQKTHSGYLHLGPGVKSFAIFFWPAGWSHLFHVPVHDLANQFDEATLIHGSPIRTLWNRMGEASSFQRRVQIVEEFLLPRVAAAKPQDNISRAAEYIFRKHGAVRIPRLGRNDSLSLRQFERLFRRDVGMPAKTFACIARFQSAIDAKLAHPERTWLDVAHSFGYFDQMHMIHDFKRLGRNAPTEILQQMGDVRPAALVTGST